MGEIVLVRHGETEGESSIRLNGSTDVALNELGRRQMREVGGALRGEHFDVALASPLRRSLEGLQLVLGQRGPRPTVIAAFTEIDFGDWEGWTHAEAETRDPENHLRWREQGVAFRFPGGDSREGFHARVAAAVPKVFNDTERATLAVLHKGVIKVIIGELLGLSFEQYRNLSVELASVHRLHHDGHGWARVGPTNPR